MGETQPLDIALATNGYLFTSLSAPAVAKSRPKTGQSFYLILPSVNTQPTSIALQEFASQINPSQDKIILLMLDSADWHTSKDLQLPSNLVLLNTTAWRGQSPAANTPQLASAETIVPLLRKAPANQAF